MLHNSNLCNPSVLDRLNPLLEPGGELLVNENGVMNGEPRIVRPHSNFRIFLTMDPAYGEVSRAMRNRCVEIARPHPTSLSESKLADLIDCSAVVSSRVRDLMVRAHMEITERILAEKDGLSRGESSRELDWDPLTVSAHPPVPRSVVSAIFQPDISWHKRLCCAPMLF